MTKETNNKWVKVLDEAGLLDEIEDGWTISGKPGHGSTITVEGAGGGAIPTTVAPPSRESSSQEERKPRRPRDGPRDTQPRRPQSRRSEPREMPRTPVERLRSSSPAKRAQTDQGQPLIAVSSAKRTALGLPIQNTVRMSSNDPASSFPDLYEAAQSPESRWDLSSDKDEAIPSRESTEASSSRGEVQPEAEHVVRVGSKRISVAPESTEDSSKEQAGAIVDDPGDYNRPSLRSEVPVQRDLEQEVNDLYDVGDYSGALDIIEEILAQHPDDPLALRMKDDCKEVLIGMYESRIGSFDRAPKTAINEHELVWRNLDPSTGFVLSRIDGMTTFDEVIDISGLPRFETCRILDRLLQDGIIE